MESVYQEALDKSFAELQLDHSEKAKFISFFGLHLPPSDLQLQSFLSILDLTLYFSSNSTYVPQTDSDKFAIYLVKKFHSVFGESWKEKVRLVINKIRVLLDTPLV
ncbi:MAG: hypothetical protein ACP5N9_02895 [Candidatus Bilamarchaeum sp.]